MAAQGVDQTRAAEQNLSAALANLRAVAENYPQLRATENFQRLQASLAEIEDEIQASRRIYNSNVQSYNTKIQVFPNSIVANQGGFTAARVLRDRDRRRPRAGRGLLHPARRRRAARGQLEPAAQPAQGAPAGLIGSPVPTTSNAVPGTSLSWLRFSSSQRGSVEPLMYQFEPLSATIIP